MRRLVLVAAAFMLLGGVAAVAQTEPEPSPDPGVPAKLAEAYQNELDANARYLAFAAKADEEGYTTLASFFRAAGAAEKVHASIFAKMIRERGGKAEATAAAPEVGATAENLAAAIQAEVAERDAIYRRLSAALRSAADEKAADLVEKIRGAEVEHANTLLDASRRLEELRSGPRTWYVCSGCGFTTDLKLPKCLNCPARGKWITVK
ncbi:MAG: rubrerythrin family protein [Thermoanaerobaculia bacterium]